MDDVTLVERRPIDATSVHERTVRRLQVEENELAVAREDLRVLFGDRLRRKREREPDVDLSGRVAGKLEDAVSSAGP